MAKLYELSRRTLLMNPRQSPGAQIVAHIRDVVQVTRGSLIFDAARAQHGRCRRLNGPELEATGPRHVPARAQRRSRRTAVDVAAGAAAGNQARPAPSYCAARN